jgi:hypothetical protein
MGSSGIEPGAGGLSSGRGGGLGRSGGVFGFDSGWLPRDALAFTGLLHFASHSLVMTLEELHGFFMLLGFSPSIKCSEVSAFVSLRIQLSRIEAKLPRFQFADHVNPPDNALLVQMLIPLPLQMGCHGQRMRAEG